MQSNNSRNWLVAHFFLLVPLSGQFLDQLEDASSGQQDVVQDSLALVWIVGQPLAYVAQILTCTIDVSHGSPDANLITTRLPANPTPPTPLRPSQPSRQDESPAVRLDLSELGGVGRGGRVGEW